MQCSVKLFWLLKLFRIQQMFMNLKFQVRSSYGTRQVMSCQKQHFLTDQDLFQRFDGFSKHKNQTILPTLNPQIK